MNVRQAAVGLAVGAGLVACGGSEELITADDLPNAVLQREDVEIGGLTDATVSYEAASATYGNRFEVPAAEATPGDVVCILSGVALFENVGAARIALNELVTFASLAGEEPSGDDGFEFQEVDVPNLGDESAAFRTISPGSLFCMEYETTPIEQHAVAFRTDRILATVTVVNIEFGASLDEAVELARVQESRINQVLN